MTKTYIQLIREQRENPSDAVAQEIKARQEKHAEDMRANEPFIGGGKTSEKFKVLVQGDAHTTEYGGSFSVLSHVLIFSEIDAVWVAVRYEGNNGTIFTSEQEAKAAISAYKRAAFHRRFDRTEISAL